MQKTESSHKVTEIVVLKAWPGHPALKAFRESGKECHFYAYAPPTR